MFLGDGVPDAGYEFVRRMLANDLVIYKSGSKLVDAAGKAGQDDALIVMGKYDIHFSRNESKGNVNAIVVRLRSCFYVLVFPTYMSIGCYMPQTRTQQRF